MPYACYFLLSLDSAFCFSPFLPSCSYLPYCSLSLLFVLPFFVIQFNSTCLHHSLLK